MGAGDHGEGSAYQTIVTERLHLRPRRSGDDLALKAQASNPAIAPNLCATICTESAFPLAIIEHATGRLVGGAEYGATGLGSGIEASVWIGEPDWSQGFATEATQALVDRVFANCETDIVWCSNRVTNDRARRVIEKCGFQFRGTGMVRLPGRGAYPIERFSLSRSAWTSLKAWGSGHRKDHRHVARETAA